MTSQTAKLPSVTRILGPWSDFGSIPEAVLEKAAQRGTAVHQACHGLAQGLWVPPDEEIEPFLKSFRQWLPCVEIMDMEFHLVDHDLGFVGHPDLMARFKGDSLPSLIDYKTPVQFNRLWRPQLAAYKHLCHKNGLEVERVCSLRLSRHGRPPIINELTGHYAVDLAGFMAALTAWKYFNNTLLH